MVNQSAFPSTLQPSQPKREVRRDQILGGPVGFIDEILKDTVEYIVGTPVNESPGPRIDLESGQWQEIRPAVESSISGFQKPRAKEDAHPELKASNIAESILAIHKEAQMNIPVSQKRIDVNSKIGIGNILYEDTVNDDGTLRVDVPIPLDRKNSELDSAQLKTNKENQIAQARGKAKPGFQMRQGELDMGKERAGGGHFTTAPG